MLVGSRGPREKQCLSFFPLFDCHFIRFLLRSYARCCLRLSSACSSLSYTNRRWLVAPTSCEAPGGVGGGYMVAKEARGGFGRGSGEFGLVKMAITTGMLGGQGLPCPYDLVGG